jgi:pyruvate formate lyase activating enzyme
MTNRQELGPDTPWHISRFFPAYRMADIPPTPLATLQRAKANKNIIKEQK